MEAVKPMVTMGRGGNPRRPNVFGHVRGNRRCRSERLPYELGDRERPKLEVYSATWDVSLASWGPEKA